VKRLSVVIVSYNSERYVGATIESALALEWDDVEIVAVDNGSTDGTPEVIKRYADRIVVCLNENAPQRVGASNGFALTSGDVVVFLDHDDILPPDLPAHLEKVWTPTTSKVQLQMQRIDENGVPMGVPYPAYRPVPSPADIRRWVERTTAYPTPPGSGNAYARWFLERLFPLDARTGDATDSACLAAAPFLGDVVSLPGVFVGYRRHADNDSNLMKDLSRFPREVERARIRWRYAQRVAGVPEAEIDERPLFRSRELLQFRVAARRVRPADPGLPGDSRIRMLGDALRAPFQIGPEPVERRVLVSLWSIATLLAPERISRRLVVTRYREGR
jgi:glycosyltransferase involved in cell wall biosynthesis